MFSVTTAVVATRQLDVRNVASGTSMLKLGYLDQPYCDKMPKGRWVCTITGSLGAEGSSGEHVMAIWSEDKGVTWSKPVSVEPAPLNTELANAYSMTLVAPGVGADGADRVYAIYNMNLANVSQDGPSGPHISRVDMLGTFNMRYSDDAGESWSATRYAVPYRNTSIDTNNEVGGAGFEPAIPRCA